MKVWFLGEKRLYKLQIFWISFNSQAFPKRESLLSRCVDVKIFVHLFRKKIECNSRGIWEISFTPRFIKSCFEKILVLNTTYWRWVTSGYHAMIQPIRTKERRRLTRKRDSDEWAAGQVNNFLASNSAWNIQSCLNEKKYRFLGKGWKFQQKSTNFFVASGPNISTFLLMLCSQ